MTRHYEGNVEDLSEVPEAMEVDMQSLSSIERHEGGMTPKPFRALF